jgi:protein TonB
MAAGSGIFVSLTVFTLLWQLVSVPLEERPPIAAFDIQFTRLRFDTPIETKRRERIERPPATIAPEAPPAGPIVAGGEHAAFVRPAFDPPALVRPTGARLRPDGDVIPIVRPDPEYPRRELERGTEGWVQVRFVVTAIGSVRDAVVVAADPPTVFDAAALKAIARWRYNPKIENGVAVERVGIQTVIRFQIDR